MSKAVLLITVTHKTTDEMAAQYGFNDEQKEWLEELLKPEYHGLWNGLLYGITSICDGSLIEIADTQIGNIGGEPYWRWYGFNSHVAWCACFVSWCADQVGYIDAGIIPRFSLCDDGIRWFKNRGQWHDNGYIPAPGDIIFFDWDGDGGSDHVGIVERTEGDYIHTMIVRARAVNENSQQIRFIDVVSPKLLENVFQSIDFFNALYDPGKTVTNGEIARTAVRLASEEFNLNLSEIFNGRVL